MTIQSINSTDEGLEIFWSDSNVSCFPWFWLRDHSESTVDLHPDTKQRQIDSFSIPLDNTVNKVWLDENAHNLYVKWEDQSESCLSYGLLECMATPILDNISNDKPRETPKNIFLPNVTSRVEPKTKSIANKIIAISVIGLISRLYNSTSKTPDLSLFSDKNWICLIIFQVVSSSGSFFRLSIRSWSNDTVLL